ncbi:hypothetical protein ACWCQN_44600 [Streptomyces sp. NPDC001984]
MALTFGAGQPGMDRPGMDRPGMDRPGMDRLGMDRLGADQVGMDRPGMDRLGADQVGLDRLGLDRLARVLRPVFRRDLARGHARGVWPLPDGGRREPAGALLGCAALLAATGAVLHTATRRVDTLARRGEPGAGQWRPVLAAAFVDLLACESLTVVALRALAGRGAVREAGDTAGPEAGGAGGPDKGGPGEGGPGEGGPGAGGSDSGGAGAGGGGVAGEGAAGRDGTAGLVAAVGYAVPLLAGEVLGDLELVLNECGLGADSPERRMLAKIARDRGAARVDGAAAAGWQACLVRGLGAWAGPVRHGEPPELPALFRLEDAVPDTAGADCHGAVAATLTAATARLARAGDSAAAADGDSAADGDGDGDGDGAGGGGGGGGDPARAALARLGRRLVTEQRALRAACTPAAVHGPAAVHDPADPAARALADRQALLLLAAAVLGVREAAAVSGARFLGGPQWALLALGRIAGRLGAPLPAGTPAPHTEVWAELAARGAQGVDCDVYATRLLPG